MKNFKKIASAIAALSLAACVAVPMSATVFTASAAGKITVTSPTSDTGTHTYEAYQIFKGDYDATDKVLSNVEWAVDDQSSASTLLNDVKAIQLNDATKPFEKCNSAKDVAEALSKAAKAAGEETKDLEITKAFANVIANYVGAGKLFATSLTDMTVTTPGYYFIQETSTSPAEDTGEKNNGAKTRYILEILDTTKDYDIAAKSAAPTVDKLVKDEVADAEKKADGTTDSEGWGETADHAINETFQFKLNAQLPNEAEIENYKSYRLVFTDTLSAGVDINTNPNMKIYLNGTTESVALSPKPAEGVEPNAFYEITENGKKITVTIKDVKALDKFTDAGGKLQNLLVSVVYDAHLNENAIVSDSNLVDTTTYNTGENANINNNKVSLKYSNNPNRTGSGEPELGQTPEDTVGVFTYKVTNSKVDSVEKNKKLAGATFELYDTNPATGSPEPIKLVKMTGDGKTGCYRLATEAEAASEEDTKPYVTSIDTVADQDFIFYGLDAGTYYLKETKAPDGYNSLGEAVKIEIKATHAENSAGTGAGLTLNSTDNKSTYNEGEVSQLKGEIENAKGATLPSTGGIGTTLFYLGGGALVAVAGVMLITKKRMTKE